MVGVAVGLFAGPVLVAFSAWLTTKLGEALRSERVPAPQIEINLWCTYLIAASAIYVAFALREAGDGWMYVELLGMLVYSLLALAGLKRPWTLALGWALHALWDVVVHAGAPGEFVPHWYRWACLTYDVGAAYYVLIVAARLKR